MSKHRTITPPALKHSPLFLALLLAFPAAPALAAESPALPVLGQARQSSVLLRPNPDGLTFVSRSDDKLFVVSPEYSDQTGFGLNATLAGQLGPSSAAGLLVCVGYDKDEWLLNLGLDLDARQSLIFSAGQLRQKLEYAFPSGADTARLTQNGGGISYQYRLGQGLLAHVELNGYLADTGSRDLADQTYAVDSASLYELWNDPRRIAGGRVTGLQGRLGLAPMPGAQVTVSVGAERLDYDLQAGKARSDRLTGGIEWQQRLANDLSLKVTADHYAAQDRYRLGLERQLSGGQRLGVELSNIQGRDGAPDDSRVALTWSIPFGASTRHGGMGLRADRPTTPIATATPAQQANSGLLDRVARRPDYLPSQVVARVDTTVAPTRLIAVDKTVLPGGTSVDSASGDITAPTGGVVAGITGVTRNGAAFTNTGQFSLSGNNLVVHPNLISQPVVGVKDTYVVSISLVGGGATLATVVVSHGSVKIDSITMTTAPGTEAAAPTASAVSISGTAQVGQTLTGGYSYADANSDPEGTSTYRWLRNGVAIAGATARTYTLVNADQGTAITFEVTPVSTVAPTTGTPVASSATASVAGAGVAAAPTASGVSISGTAQVGQTLTGGYSYADANSDPEGTSTYRWLRNGVAIAGATATTYTLVAADQGATITFEVTPISTVAPTTGTAVTSSATAPVAGAGVAAAPTASGVIISGTAQVGQTLTGGYSYADANSDPEGSSTFRWFRNGSAIAGATARTYTLVNADQGATITFEVTPVSTIAPTTGTAVASSATATIAGVGTPSAPTASGVTISGTAQVGQTLTGGYSYADANSDPEGASTFRWFRNGSAIAGATAITYTLVAADQGTAITFEVTPISTIAPTTGTAVTSSATAPIAGTGVAAAPTASGVSISGTAQVGQTLTGGYTYADANSDPEGASTYRWLRNGVAIAGATATTYTLVAADQGKTITFEVTPVSTVAPTTGTAVASSATATIAGAGVAAAPTASGVSISGTAQVGQTLTGGYSYADANSDPEGSSTFRWLRNGTAIAGATATTYTLVAADQGATLTFEVTPVSTVAPITGTAVASSATAPVAGIGTAAAPTASGVSISGTAQVGQTLTGGYSYVDANSDPEGSSTFRWFRNGSAIAGATARTYTLVNADQGATITFEVTPVSTIAPTTGTAVTSSATASVAGVGVAAAPSASAVSITGTAQVGQTLTGGYSYADANSDPEGTSTFRWFRNGSAIAGATARTYTLVNADQGATITFEVTPVSTIAPTTGTAVASSATATIAGVGTPSAPTASGVTISGTAQVGQTLTGGYSYADANSDPEGASTFRWFRNGSAIAGATAITYTLVAADQGATITFEVTPVSTIAPTTGTAVTSSATASVAGVGTAAAPTASGVSISGTAQVGQTLTGGYSYADANSDPQGTSTFRWLRNGVAITGATATTYTLVAADQGATITFEVTPVSTVAPTTGTAVTSSATVSVAGVGTPAAPTASGVSITGTAQVGQTLTGGYSYADANSDPQGISTFRWLRNGVAIAGATATTYTLVAADQGTTITFEVTPVATVAPTTGSPVVSSATVAVTADGALPAGYVSQGGLIWSPVRGSFTWGAAYSYCTSVDLLGQTGWRLPTEDELVSLYSSGEGTAQGWPLELVWSSTPGTALVLGTIFGIPTWLPSSESAHRAINLRDGRTDAYFDDGMEVLHITCVR